VGHVERMEEMRKVYKILVRKYVRKRTLARPSRRWEINIIMDLREVQWEGASCR
jgi:hypothetical protein